MVEEVGSAEFHAYHDLRTLTVGESRVQYDDIYVMNHHWISLERQTSTKKEHRKSSEHSYVAAGIVRRQHHITAFCTKTVPRTFAFESCDKRVCYRSPGVYTFKTRWYMWGTSKLQRSSYIWYCFVDSSVIQSNNMKPSATWFVERVFVGRSMKTTRLLPTPSKRVDKKHIRHKNSRHTEYPRQRTLDQGLRGR